MSKFKKELYPEEKKCQVNDDYSFYRTDAKRIIKKFGGDIKGYLLKNHEALGKVIHALMMADWRHDETRPKHSSKSTYRVACGKWMIGTLRKDFFKKQEEKELQLEDFNNITSFNYKDNRTTELVEYYLEKLPEMERIVIESYYLNNQTVADISRKLNLSKFKINKFIESALCRLRGYSESI